MNSTPPADAGAKAVRWYIALYRCTQHKFEALMLETGDGGICTRMTASKCCGRWDKQVKRWHITPRDAREWADRMEEIADGD